MSFRLTPRFVFLFFSFSLFPSLANAWEGVIMRVHDGDTVLVAPEGASHGDMMVRLYGIDAPELDRNRSRGSRKTLKKHL